LQWHERPVHAEFRVLTDVISHDIYAGAAIALHPLFTDVMIASTLSPANAFLGMSFIHLTEKQKNFIHRLKIRA
jgi:hypothetical protein